MNENDIARIIVDSAFKVHNALGPGLLESVYRAALAFELTKRGLRATTEQPIPAFYEDVHLEIGFRAERGSAADPLQPISSTSTQV